MQGRGPLAALNLMFSCSRYDLQALCMQRSAEGCLVPQHPMLIACQPAPYVCSTDVHNITTTGTPSLPFAKHSQVLHLTVIPESDSVHPEHLWDLPVQVAQSVRTCSRCGAAGNELALRPHGLSRLGHVVDHRLPASLQERSDALLQKVKKVAPTYRTRPSLFAPASSAAAFSLGAVSAALPQNLRNAVSGAHRSGHSRPQRQANQQT